MCGIIGWIGQGINHELALQMRDRLTHRGPDDSGYWHHPEAGVWMGHRRLAILDLSPGGKQPMTSQSGRFIIVFNGEIFNFIELKKELEAKGSVFKGHSDTEVMLTAIEVWGIDVALERFVGMFAFALWDRDQRCMTLVRDRLGIKPLYYASAGGQLAFSSEMHALAAIPWIDTTIDQNSVAAYLHYRCVPAPATILKEVRKLEPGTLLTWRSQKTTINRYWHLKEIIQNGLSSPVHLSFHEASNELESRLKEAIAMRMRSDVPYGAFLSGGIDSSLVVALMSSISSRPVNTFTIGFPNNSHDESIHARKIAAHFGTHHHEQILDPERLFGLIDKVVLVHDEPFADGSSFPTYLLSHFARQHVTVALSGDGGDEFYGGYPRYFWASRIHGWRKRFGPFAIRCAASALRCIPKWIWNGPINQLSNKRYAGTQGLSTRVRRLADFLTTDPGQADAQMMTAWPDPAEIMVSTPDVLENRYRDWHELDWPEQMMAVDQTNYLPNEILTKIDRSSMNASLEVRAPILDHRLVEWSWRLPRAYKFNETGDRGKRILREVLYRHIPPELMERPKSGFGMPMDQWLRAPLRDWAEDILSKSSLNSSSLLQPDPIRRVWLKHLAGENRLPQLWTVLMLELWLKRWRRQTGTVN